MMPCVLTDELAAVLRVVAQADFCEPSTIAKAHGRAVAEQLELLRAAGLIMRNAARRADRKRTTLYTITSIGRHHLHTFDAGFRARECATGSVPAVATVRTAHLTAGGTYTGAELRPFDGRPGAMDAFALPSRMGRRLHYRDGRVQQIAAASTPASCVVVGVDVGADRSAFGPVTVYHGSPDCVGHAFPLSGRAEVDAC